MIGRNFRPSGIIKFRIHIAAVWRRETEFVCVSRHWGIQATWDCSCTSLLGLCGIDSVARPPNGRDERRLLVLFPPLSLSFLQQNAGGRATTLILIIVVCLQSKHSAERASSIQGPNTTTPLSAAAFVYVRHRRPRFLRHTYTCLGLDFLMHITFDPWAAASQIPVTRLYPNFIETVTNSNYIIIVGHFCKCSTLIGFFE